MSPERKLNPKTAKTGARAVGDTIRGGYFAASRNRKRTDRLLLTGPGIPVDHLERLFDRFWQADRADRRGIGLGLAIAKAIVTAHGGTIGVTSKVGQGSEFHFDLPVA